MRNLFSSKYMYLTAAMLTGAAMFTSCSNEDDMGNVNPTYDGESVKTQFAINIPAAGKADTKMTAENTQNSSNFLGMYNLRLLTMTEAAPTNNAITSIITTLGNIGTGEITDGTKESKIFNDVNVPVGTKNFLFYAAGGGTSAPSSDADKFAKGIIEATNEASDIDNISFKLVGAKSTTAQTEDENILDVLNAIATVQNWSTQSTGSTLGDLYKNFKTLKAGSATSVCKALENLYNSVDELAKGTGTEANTIAVAIQNAIKTDDHFTVSDDAPYTITTSLIYPRNINMPDGAAILSFNEQNSDEPFSYQTTSPTIGTSFGVNMDNICFPAPIYYFVNTDLKANNEVPDSWPQTLTNWESGFSGWGTEVTTSTRAIALTKAIQYGVAQLEMSVKCANSTLEDNKGNMISVPTGGFKVTGVLIGGQPSQAGWNLEPSTNASFDKVVYDNALTNVAATTNDNGGTNYTLVLDNKQATPAVVNIAIEFENGTGDFYGVKENNDNDGIIPAGTKFYLIAQLDPTNKTVSGYTGTPYVFMQDYKTTAKFTISSLKNAYNTIPDLRATEMQLGLAVDLDWKIGISFDVEIQ